MFTFVLSTSVYTDDSDGKKGEYNGGRDGDSHDQLSVVVVG